MIDNHPLSKSQRGQAIILVAGLALAMVALAGLALDGGQVYQWRRVMQDAADGGVIAGAYTMTLGATDPQISSTIQQYAVVNNRAEAFTWTKTGPVASCLTVTTTKNFPSLFIGLIGISSLDAKAHATACAGQPTGAGNLWPLLVPTNTYAVGFAVPITMNNDSWADFGNTGGNINPNDMGIGYQGAFVTWPVGVNPVCNTATPNQASSQLIPPTCIHLKSGQSNQADPILTAVCPHVFNKETFTVPIYNACTISPCKSTNNEYFRVVGFGRFELDGYQVNSGKWCGKPPDSHNVPNPGCPAGCVLGKFVNYVDFHDICLSGCGAYTGTLSVALIN